MASEDWKLCNEIETAFCSGDFHIWSKGDEALVVRDHEVKVMNVEELESWLR